jgi:hypothetical protein
MAWGQSHHEDDEGRVHAISRRTAPMKLTWVADKRKTMEIVKDPERVKTGWREGNEEGNVGPGAHFPISRHPPAGIRASLWIPGLFYA